MITRPFAPVPALLAALLFIPAVAVPAAAVPPPQAPAGQVAPPEKQQQRPALHGVRNFTSVDSTFACGGALADGAMAALKEAGFATVVNLRAATEDGANVEAETAAAASAGIRYVHLPFVSASPDAARVDEFLEVVSDPASQPVLLHCASGGRASMFWAIKRVMIDGWAVEKALAELPDLSKNVSEALKTFTLGYLKTHGK